MFNFLNLPTELQLRILDFVPPKTMINVVESNKQLNALGLSSLSSNINNLTAENNSIFISVFSPQNKNRLIETFNTICVSNPSSKQISSLSTPTFSKSLQTSQIDMNQVSDKLYSLLYKETENKPILFQTLLQAPKTNYNTVFQLGNLEYTKDPLKINQMETPISNSIKNGANSNMNLIVNEDEPFIKLHIEMKLKNSNGLSSLFKFNTKLSQLDSENTSVNGVISSEDNAVTVDYILEKGMESPPRDGYDYDVFYNYQIKFGEIQVNNGYLMHSIENVN